MKKTEIQDIKGVDVRLNWPTCLYNHFHRLWIIVQRWFENCTDVCYLDFAVLFFGVQFETFDLQDSNSGISVYLSYYLYAFTCRLHLKDCLNNPSIEGGWTRVFIFTPFIYRIWPLCVKNWPKWRVRRY